MPLRLLALLAIACCLLACSTSNGGSADAAADREGSAGDVADAGHRDSGKHDARESSLPEAGIPFLVDLSVTGASPTDASAPITLIPRFSPTIFDYYVRCGAGKNVLTVSMTASPGAESLLTQPELSASAPKQTLQQKLMESDAIVAVATDDKSSQEYWVRCLPHDFPHLNMTLEPEAGAPTPGYYLLGNVYGQAGGGTFAMVLDLQGVPVWYTRQTPGQSVYDVDTVLSGTISFAPPFVVHQLSPPLTSYILPFGYPSDEHELRRLSNGDYLVIFATLQTGIDLTGLVLPLLDGGTESFGTDGSIISCDILEINPANVIVWGWSATDHFDPVADMEFKTRPALIGPDGGPVVETFHCNSIDVDTNGNLLVSARHMDSIFYIEKATGAVVWKMGGATFSKDKDPPTTYVPVSDSFHRQHDARFLPSWKPTCTGGSGQISLFDDETDLPAAARAVVYDVNIAAEPGDGGTAGDCGVPADAAETGASVAWQFKGTTNADSLGSFRILPDGTRLIGWGSNMTVAFTEVDSAKRVLLDFSFGDGNVTYRALKAPLGAFDLGVLRRTAGQ